MITMSCNHPDILEFIKKKQDLTKVTGANISVQLTNDFMEAVKNDTDYILRWPVDIHIRPEEYNDLPYNQLKVFEIQCGKVYLRKIKARDYWKELIHCAWNTGEPGIMFKDIHLENSPETGYQEYRGITTNPCLTGDTIISTAFGEKLSLKEIVNKFNKGEQVSVLSIDIDNFPHQIIEEVITNAVLTKKNAEILKISVEGDKYIKVTPDHKIYILEKGWVEAKDLSDSDYVLEISDNQECLIAKKVLKIEKAENEDVYDITTSINHNFLANNILVHNCGEIFMEAYDSCRLIACNLSAFVKNKYTKEAYFDFDEFKNAVKIGMHISDDLVDAESKCVERIIKNIDPKSTTELELWTKIRNIGLAGRRCGFGITALGDMLAMLGLKFDSQEALDMVDKVMNTKFTTEVEVEIELGQERGVFKGFSKDKEVSSKFSKKLFEIVGKDLWEKYTTLGRRNISWSTVAPTGSLSILTQTTSGIEPIFSPYYIRRKKCGPNDRVDFVDKNGQGFSEFLVIHHGLVDWFKIVGKELSEKLGLDYKEDMQYKFEEMNKIFEFSPWFQSTANDIDWGKRVDIQSIIQRYITHSISSTVNLPNSATEEDVSNIYLRAYDKDLKGITVN